MKGLPSAQVDLEVSTGGYRPGWRWVQPPGVGDAPQHVYTTFSLFPLAIDGPGDRPATYFRSVQAPMVQNFAARYQGVPVQGGSFVMSGLYTPMPLLSPNNLVYPRF